jgi:prepilin-type processing-associated H-X9-DG protein
MAVATPDGLRYTSGMTGSSPASPPKRDSRPARSVQPARRGAAFSLIELLITLVLLIVMVTMFWGFGSRSEQEKQKRACQKNLQTLFVALEIFAGEHDGAFPVSSNAQTSEGALAALVPRYTVDTAPFICPGSKDSRLPQGESFANRRISYAYWMGRRLTDTNALLLSDKQINTLPKGEGQFVFSHNGKPPGNNHHRYGGNFLFVDGHAEFSPARTPFAIAWPAGVALLNPKP